MDAPVQQDVVGRHRRSTINHQKIFIICRIAGKLRVIGHVEFIHLDYSYYSTYSIDIVYSDFIILHIVAAMFQEKDTQLTE